MEESACFASHDVKLTYRENYWDSPRLKRRFIRYLVQVFGLDLSLWDKRGYWDPGYRPFSYFDGSELVANVCVYSMDMTVRGKKCRVAQLSAVGTLEEYRRKGLGTDLMARALDWAQNNHEFSYLFADKNAYGLYRECGFSPTAEYKPCLAVGGGAARADIVHLDVERKDHLELIYHLASARIPVSDLLGVSNERLLMFWCLYALRNFVYYVPKLDVLVLYKREGDRVTIYDIVGTSVPPFSEIYPYICDEQAETVDFLFMVDKLNLTDYDLVRTDDNGTHVRGAFPLGNTKFIFPITSQA